jgi:DNA invertase Pin-like site-specific DNA recombinase
MKNRKFIAYFRVSTARQGRSGLGLDAQKLAVGNFLAGERAELVGEHTEIESGRRTDRPELERALATCRVHGATLVIAKLDRLARNVEFIARLMNSGVEFVASDMPAANKLTIHVMAAMAEYEREAISARTKAALAQAKIRGVKLGGDRGGLGQIASLGGRACAQARREAACKRTADLRPFVEDIQRSGVVTLRGIAHELMARGIPNGNLSKWHPSQVARILAATGH